MPQFTDNEQRIQELRHKEEEELMQMLSEKYGLQYIDLTNVSLDMNALKLIPEEKARDAQLAAFEKNGSTVAIALRSPTSDSAQSVMHDLEERGYAVKQYLASSQSLEHAWKRYSDITYAVESEAGVLDISSEEIHETIEEMDTVADVKAHISEVLNMERSHRISRIVEIIIASGLALEASDVHIEPAEERVRLRVRLDGVLTDLLHFDRETYELLRSRIKLLAKMRLNVHDEAQDGRFSIKLDQRDIEIRASALPGSYGESLVMRILDPQAINMTLEELGMDERLLEIMKEEIKRPNGMILTTGPTGSGKTTTLYAILRRINEPNIKIITIEDPVEYHLEGIVQSQAEKDGFTFLEGLRSALRQDPDIIMVGEIRDEGVARTGVNAALTGHLVLSTLHTNTAAGTFPRMIDLGADPKIVGSAINIALGQRLVRRLCDACKETMPLTGRVRETVQNVLDGIHDTERVPDQLPECVYEPVGCEACKGTGFRGRVGLFEAVLMTRDIEALVREKPSERDVRAAAQEQGILTMPQDGVLKVLDGITAFDELERVVELVER